MHFERLFKSLYKGILKNIEGIGNFGFSSLEYLFHKVDQLFWIFTLINKRNAAYFTSLKFHIQAMLIWSKGRLGRRFKYLFLIIFGWSLFLTGGVFQGLLVKKETSSETYFIGNNRSLLLESATAATYESEKKLLDAPVEHTVLDGETLQSIGKKYGVTFESIKFANNLTANTVKKDQVLIIPPVEGTVHKVKKGDTVEKLATKYRVASQSIIDFNYLDAPYLLEEGMLITVPDAKEVITPRYYAGNTGYDTSAYGVIPYAGTGVKGSGEFIWPLSGILSQGFSSYHPAIDIATNTGDIIAADKGTVVRAGWWQGGYGNAVQIDHGNGYVTTYAHMSSIAVSQGQEVDKGQKIGVVGSTGRSTGPHCHFTVQKDGKYLNPLTVL